MAGGGPGRSGDNGDLDALRVLFEHAPVAQFIADANGAILLANPAYAALVGSTVEEVVGSGPADITHPDDLRPLLRQGRNLLLGEVDRIDVEVRVRTSGGTYRWCLATCSAARGALGEPIFVSQLLDVDDRRQTEEQLAHRATHDVLTGLPNRALLLDRLEQAVDRVRSSPSDEIALLFIDLDRFKTVNDELGHDVGDQLLRVVAERLARALRAVDVVARLGGDEFVVLCPGLGRAEAEDVADRLLRAVSSTPVHVGGQLVDVTASVGVTVAAGSDDHHAEGLLREADVAMYQAKAQGRNRFETYED